MTQVETLNGQKLVQDLECFSEAFEACDQINGTYVGVRLEGEQERGFLSGVVGYPILLFIAGKPVGLGTIPENTVVTPLSTINVTGVK